MDWAIEVHLGDAIVNALLVAGEASERGPGEVHLHVGLLDVSVHADLLVLGHTAAVAGARRRSEVHELRLGDDRLRALGDTCGGRVECHFGCN